MKTALIFVLLLTSTTLPAQEAYKCKVGGATVIQDTPCKVVGPVPAIPDLPASEETIARAAALCEAAVRHKMKDPAAAKITDIHRSRTDRWCTKPTTTQVRYYWMTVNGKNSYGAYVGEKPYRCALDMSETLVLGISQIGESENIVPCNR